MYRIKEADELRALADRIEAAGRLPLGPDVMDTIRGLYCRLPAERVAAVVAYLRQTADLAAEQGYGAVAYLLSFGRVFPGTACERVVGTLWRREYDAARRAAVAVRKARAAARRRNDPLDKPPGTVYLASLRVQVRRLLAQGGPTVDAAAHILGQMTGAATAKLSAPEKAAFVAGIAGVG